MKLIEKYNKAIILARYINIMNRRINAAPMPPDHLVEYEKSCKELLDIIKIWPEIIEEGLRCVDEVKAVKYPA